MALTDKQPANLPHRKLEFDPNGAALTTNERPYENLYHQLKGNVAVTTTDQVFAWARKSSLWPLTFGLACCAIEMMSAYMAHHDLDRFGVIPWPSPRQADLLIVSGTVTYKMGHAIKLLWEQMPEPKWAIAMGACAIDGGPYVRSYAVTKGVDQIVPVDVYVPGCPPRPEALVFGIMHLQEKIQRGAKAQRSAARPVEQRAS